MGQLIHALTVYHMLSTCALNAARAPKRENDTRCSYILNNTSGMTQAVCDLTILKQVLCILYMKDIVLYSITASSSKDIHGIKSIPYLTSGNSTCFKMKSRTRQELRVKLSLERQKDDREIDLWLKP